MSEESVFFSFGEPESVVNSPIASVFNSTLAECGEYFIPPVQLSGLGKMRQANAQHGSCIVFRRNMAAKAYQGGGLSMADFRKSITDFLSFGNAYIEVVRNRLGKVVELVHVSALNMRVRTKSRGYRLLLKGNKYIDFEPNEIIHIKEYDTSQEVYGLPDWLGGLQAIFLNEDATLFRRKYFKNGCHLGYIFYMNDAKMTPSQEDSIKRQLKEGKGAGNFRTMFINIPNGAKDAIQIMPIGDISQKDEFKNIKSLSAADVREAHRVPPLLMGVIPEGSSSLGDPIKVYNVYQATEVAALSQVYEAINEQLPQNLQLKFSYPMEVING